MRLLEFFIAITEQWVASVSPHCEPIDSVILARGGYGHTLFTQKTAFCFHSSYAAITAQTSIAPNHSVTWNDGWVWVLAASIGYRTGRIRMTDLNRNFGVGSDLAPRDFFHCIPDLDLELGTLKRWVLGHMYSRCLDNIMLPIIARVPLLLTGIQRRFSGPIQTLGSVLGD